MADPVSSPLAELRRAVERLRAQAGLDRSTEALVAEIIATANQAPVLHTIFQMGFTGELPPALLNAAAIAAIAQLMRATGENPTSRRVRQLFARCWQGLLGRSDRGRPRVLEDHVVLAFARTIERFAGRSIDKGPTLDVLVAALRWVQALARTVVAPGYARPAIKLTRGGVLTALRRAGAREADNAREVHWHWLAWPPRK